MRIHWLGAGLSSTFGIEEIVESRLFDFTLWNRDPSRAYRLIEKLELRNVKIRRLDFSELYNELNANDLVVSYLPAPFHYEVAIQCLKRKAHLMTSSYVTEEMQHLSPETHEKGLYFFNELGLDPGLDHLFAHRLVRDLNEELGRIGDVKRIEFYSGCGGFPLEPGSFCYKFSWSPLGVLRALKQRSVWLEDSQIRLSDYPWKAVRRVTVGGSKHFESYPNRDSLPYIPKYGLHKFGVAMDFQRATLRPLGWRSAWDPIFDIIESNRDLDLLSRELFSKHAYNGDERDRVVLVVELKAYDKAGNPVFERSMSIDKTGSHRHSAMSQLVSGTTWCALKMFYDGVLQRELEPGVYDFPYSKGLGLMWDQYGFGPWQVETSIPRAF